MTAYQYRATDQQNSPQLGHIEAASLDEARGRLLERGWTVLSLSLAESASTMPPGLSAEEAEELVQHVARLAAAGFPLGAGFRAAADECESEPVSRALRMLADRIDQGQSLAGALRDADRWLPPHVAGLIVAALRSGRLGEALLELVEHQRGTRSLRRVLWQASAYPVTVAIMATLLLSFLVVWLSNVFGTVFEEFGMALPFATRQLFWWGDWGIWLLLAAGALAVGAVWIYRRRIGPVRWAHLQSALPLLGPLFHFRSMAEWSSLMSVLVKNQVPLPDAFRWSADGVNDAWVADLSKRWAEEAALGQNITETLSSRDFPRGLTPLIRWGEKNGVLAEAFATCRELLERRVRLRSELLRTTLPPVLLLAVGCGVTMLIIGLYMPLAMLVNALGS